jgi:hypothetical protein
MKTDQTFIEIFLDFLNDKTASGERFAANLKRHPYLKQAEMQGFQFKPPTGINFGPMRQVMGGRLNQIKDGAAVGFQRWIVKELNRLKQQRPYIDLTTGAPLLDTDGKPILMDIVALATFEFGENGIQFGGLPIINGIEFACWYALLLISRIPRKIRRCTACNKWFNLEKTRRVGFCSKGCAREHNRLMQQYRQHNRRNPSDKIEIIRATAEKRRKRIANRSRSHKTLG